ncbi:MAG: polysaccharide pyruvyl transferase family protein [Maritimibacter sp.]|nr:polysaccharide pyruvyl transferase family protein [Maritimibacter sp.]
MIFFQMRALYLNPGDELINVVLLDQLARRDTVVALTSGVPDWYMENVIRELGELASRVVFEPSAAGFFSKLAANAVKGRETWLYLSPGETTQPPELDGRDRLKSAILSGLQVLPDVHIGFVGQSTTRVSPSRERVLRKARKRGDVIAVRDADSCTYLQSRGISATRVPDLAFALDRVRGRRAKTVGLSFRSHGPGSDRLLKDRLHALLPQLRDAGMTAEVFWQADYDREFCEDLARDLDLPLAERRMDRSDRLTELRSLFSRMGFLLSNRLHVLLIGASRGSIPIALLSKEDEKIGPLFRDDGLDAACIRLDDPAMIERTIAVVRGAAEFDEQFARVFERNRRAICDHFDAMHGMPDPESRS